MKQVKQKLVKPKEELLEMAASFNNIFKASQSNKHQYIYKICK